MKRFILALAFLFSLSAALGAQDFSRDKAPIPRMPDLVGQALDKVRKRLPKSSPVLVRRVNSTAKPGRVLRTVPAPGAACPNATKITLFVSQTDKTETTKSTTTRSGDPSLGAKKTPWLLYLCLQVFALLFFGLLWVWWTKPKKFQSWISKHFEQNS